MLRTPLHAAGETLRQVRRNGEINRRGGVICVSEALTGELAPARASALEKPWVLAGSSSPT